MIFIFLFLTYFTLYNGLVSSTSLQLTQMCFFLWLSNTLLRVCVCVCVCIYIYVYVYVQLLYSSVDGHLACFHALAIVNSAAVNDGTPLQYSCLENPMDGGAW